MIKSIYNRIDEALNEGMGDIDPIRKSLEAIASKVINKNTFGSDYSSSDLRYYKEQFVYSLQNWIKEPINFKQLANHPELDRRVDDRYVDIIKELAGIANSKNKEIVKAIIDAYKSFPSFDKNEFRNAGEVYDAILSMKGNYDKDKIPGNYDGIPYQTRKALTKIISAFDIEKTLKPDELKFVKDTIKPKFERVFKNYLDDDNQMNKFISQMIKDTFSKSELDTADYSLQHLVGARFSHDFPDLFKFIKEDMIKLGGVDNSAWQKLSTKQKMTGSKNSAVVASSFSTAYLYDVEITFKGKTFKYNDVELGDRYQYSGGWN